MQAKRIQLLQGTPLFGGILDTTIDYLLCNNCTVRIADEEFFFHEGDEADGIYILESGSVAVLKDWQKQQYLLSRLAAGDCFGEIAMLDLGQRGASVLALEDCTALRIDNNRLFGLYEQDIEQFTLIQMNLARELARRLRAADERLFQNHIQAKNINGEYRFVTM